MHTVLLNESDFEFYDESRKYIILNFEPSSDCSYIVKSDEQVYLYSKESWYSEFIKEKNVLRRQDKIDGVSEGEIEILSSRMFTVTEASEELTDTDNQEISDKQVHINYLKIIKWLHLSVIDKEICIKILKGYSKRKLIRSGICRYKDIENYEKDIKEGIINSSHSEEEKEAMLDKLQKLNSGEQGLLYDNNSFCKYFGIDSVIFNDILNNALTNQYEYSEDDILRINELLNSYPLNISNEDSRFVISAMRYIIDCYNHARTEYYTAIAKSYTENGIHTANELRAICFIDGYNYYNVYKALSSMKIRLSHRISKSAVKSV